MMQGQRRCAEDLPAQCELVAPRGELAFLDSCTLPMPHPMTPLQAWDAVTARPLPLLGLAFRLRDAISTRFGVKRIGGFSGTRQADPQVGDHLDFFKIETLTPDVMSLTARDRHLDVMTCVTTTNQVLRITSSVVTHNLFGKAYMIPVAPAHKLIVWAMLARLRRNWAI